MPSNTSSQVVAIDIAAREVRFLRAAGDVLKNYTIKRRPKLEGGWAVFDIEGGQQPYIIKAHAHWAGNPSCSCPDAADRAKRQVGGYCKHIIAALLKNEDLKHQLLELFF